MIIRNQNKAFVMIEQDYHAHMSAEMIKQWVDYFLKDDPYESSILYAIRNHDCGWKPFDKQPFWNDETNMPYDFTDFPVIPKTVLYTKGVDEVEAVDPYAAALCSAHYIRFMANNSQKETRHYLKQEEERIDTILSEHPQIDSNTFMKHVSLLQFADNISLYMCLNQPGVKRENEHPFFKQGIPISTKINGIATEKIDAYWKDEQTVIYRGLPYVKPFTISLQQKVIIKKTIEEKGLLKTYEQTPYKNISITCKVK